MQVFGQLTDQGKAFAMRQESYTLPQGFIDDPKRFYDFVNQALMDATTVGSALWKSVKDLAEELLRKEEKHPASRSPDPGDIRKLADQISAVPTYWQALETPFRAYLLDLDGDPVEATLRWHTALKRAAYRGWEAAEEAAGRNSLGLRAAQKSKRTLFGVLANLLTGKGEQSDSKRE
ncbi:type I-E CRISPR-associated protein Cse1/CasA [Deinococcus lacus]|uniref:Type I-E CRISPR-associated protein Cse1/CasA n=1 Tax=Deinococcus lacus TaxID=392561 RepID=A0ABW1YI56_9DEIO